MNLCKEMSLGLYHFMCSKLNISGVGLLILFSLSLKYSVSTAFADFGKGFPFAQNAMSLFF